MVKDIPLSLVVSFCSFFGLFVLHWRYELPCQDKLPEFHYTPILGCIRVFWLVLHPLGLELDKALFGWNSVTQASLWSNTSTNKYIPAPSFGLTGMPWKRFNDLWMCIRFSDQPCNCPSEMTSEQYHWRLVDDFIKNFNEHRAQFFPHWMRFALTSPCPGGMGKAAIGSTMACQCMLRLTGNQKMAVRSRMRPVGILE